MESFMRAFAALALTCILPVPLWGDEALTEKEAVRVFLMTHPSIRTGRLRAASLEAELRAEALVPNPTFSYVVEDVASTRDEFLVLEQELPLNGRRSLMRERAEIASMSALLDAEHELLTAGHSLRLTFHETLFRERSLVILRTGVTLLDGTLGILQARERLGEASGYDLLRAKQETAEVQVRAAAAEADAASARARLVSSLGPGFLSSPLSVEDDLLTKDPLPSYDDALAFALSHRRDLQAAEARARRHELERRAGGRRRIPDPVLGGGLKRVEASGEAESGFVASLSLPLPLFDRGQLEVARARADGDRVAAEIEILRREIEADVHAALIRARTSREAAGRHGRETESDSAQLETMARTAYEEGEQGILDLLDAYRVSLQTRLRSDELLFEAKRAEIELDRALGREVRP